MPRIEAANGPVDFRRGSHGWAVLVAVNPNIEVEDESAGTSVIIDALIGNDLCLFEILSCEHGYHYVVRGQEVPRQVYLDALELAKHDRYEPDDPPPEDRIDMVRGAPTTPAEEQPRLVCH